MRHSWHTDDAEAAIIVAHYWETHNKHCQIIPLVSPQKGYEVVHDGDEDGGFGEVSEAVAFGAKLQFDML